MIAVHCVNRMTHESARWWKEVGFWILKEMVHILTTVLEGFNLKSYMQAADNGL
jgi:hypothetical protein